MKNLNTNFILFSFLPKKNKTNFLCKFCKTKFYTFSLLLLYLCCIQVAMAQDRPPDYSDRFILEDEQIKFERRWMDEKPAKGQGFSVFQRWNHFMGSRINSYEFLNSDVGENMWQAIQQQSNTHNPKNKSSSDTCVSGGQWKEVGNRQVCTSLAEKNQGYGRLDFVKLYPETGTPTIAYVGSPGGGIWAKDLTQPSSTWKPLTDYNLQYNNGGTTDISALGVSDLAIHPTNPKVMWVVTGDFTQSGGLLAVYGIGILKTIDGGNTWTKCNMPPNSPNPYYSSFNAVPKKIIVNNSNPSILYVSTNTGIYKSTDGGENFLYSSGGYNHNFSDISFKPTGDYKTIYATSGNIFYKSIDEGATWTTNGINTVTPGITHSQIATHPSQPDYVYIVASNERGGLKGVYFSKNSGSSFTKIYGNNATELNILDTSPDVLFNKTDELKNTGQGNYDLAIITDPADSTGRTLYIGGINVYKLKLNTALTGVESCKMVSFWQKAVYPSGASDNNKLLSAYKIPPKITTYTGTFTSASPTYARAATKNSVYPFTCTFKTEVSYPYAVIRFQATTTDLVVSGKVTDSLPNAHIFLSAYTQAGFTTDVNSACSNIHKLQVEMDTSLKLSHNSLPDHIYELVISTREPAPTLPLKYTITFSKPVKVINTQYSCFYETGSYVHGDIHGLKIENNRLIAVSDGGVYSAKINGDAALEWEDESKGLGIRQCYYFSNYEGGNNTNIILSGAQDNGTEKISYPNVDFPSQLIGGGDGAECIIDPTNPLNMYTAVQYNAISVTTNGGETFSTLLSTVQGSGYDKAKIKLATERAAFISKALAFDAVNKVLFAGYNNVYAVINPTDSIPTAIKIASVCSMCLVTAIKVAPSNPNIVFFVAHNSLYKVEKNPNDPWSLLPKVEVADTAFWGFTKSSGFISDFVVHPTNPDIVWVTLSSLNNHEIKVVKITKNGTSYNYERVGSGGLPKIPVNTIALDPTDPSKERLFVGTDCGVYYTEKCTNPNKSQQWYPLQGTTPTTKLPNVIVSELEIVGTAPNQVLRAATLGRGIWETKLSNLNMNCTCACTEFSAPYLAINNPNNLTITKCVADLQQNPYLDFDTQPIYDADLNDCIYVTAISATLPIKSIGEYICSGSIVLSDAELDFSLINNLEDYIGWHTITLLVTDEGNPDAGCAERVATLTYNVLITCGTNALGITCLPCTNQPANCTYQIEKLPASIGCDGLVRPNGYLGVFSANCAYKLKLTSAPITEEPVEALHNLEAGTYTFDLYQNNYYVSTITETINSIPVTNTLSVTLQKYDINPYKLGCDRAISAFASGSSSSSGVYTYQWGCISQLTNQPIPCENAFSNANNTSLQTNLCPNKKYAVTVTDGMGCTTSASIKIPVDNIILPGTIGGTDIVVIPNAGTKGKANIDATKCFIADINLHPNPTQNNTLLHYTLSSPLHNPQKLPLYLEIYNEMGQKVKQLDKVLVETNQKQDIEIETSNLPPGLYNIIVYACEQTHLLKLIKQ